MIATISKSMPTTSIRVITPDGKLFVHIAEDEHGEPAEVLINIGKTGYSVYAWADALQRLISLHLKNGIDLRTIVNEISNIHTGKATRSNGANVWSGPEGLAHALMRYLASKAKRANDDDYRPATMGRNS